MLAGGKEAESGGKAGEVGQAEETLCCKELRRLTAELGNSEDTHSDEVKCTRMTMELLRRVQSQGSLEISHVMRGGSLQ